MPRILHIESSTLTCSVALANDGLLHALRESHDTSYSHSEKLTGYIQEVLDEVGMKPYELDAVCVSKGPGSYTGLRIGVSAAKGLCYALGIPLLAVDSLQSLAYWTVNHLSEKEKANLKSIRPMIDARRMEVYTAAYDILGSMTEPITATVVDEASFTEELKNGPVLFVGDGAEKCRNHLDHVNACFRTDVNPSAQGMFALAEVLLATRAIEDVAYFEPYYLKDFVAGVKKTTT